MHWSHISPARLQEFLCLSELETIGWVPPFKWNDPSAVTQCHGTQHCANVTHLGAKGHSSHYGRDSFEKVSEVDLEFTLLYFQHISGIPNPVRNSTYLHRMFLSLGYLQNVLCIPARRSRKTLGWLMNVNTENSQCPCLDSTLEPPECKSRTLSLFHTTNKLRGLSPLAKLYRPSDRCLSAKLVTTFADRGVLRS
jgi:hypothetical protein